MMIVAPPIMAVLAQASDAAATGSGDPNMRIAVLIAALFVFVLAIFEGVEVINKVPPTLHTPLMSGSNAISGITVVGAIVCSTAESEIMRTLAPILGLLAIVFAMINVVGGYLVTDRMLKMFKRR